MRKLRELVTINVAVSPAYEYDYSDVDAVSIAKSETINVDANDQTNLDGNIPANVTHHLSGHSVSSDVDAAPTIQSPYSDVAVAPATNSETINVDVLPISEYKCTDGDVSPAAESETSNVDADGDQASPRHWSERYMKPPVDADDAVAPTANYETSDVDVLPKIKSEYTNVDADDARTLAEIKDRLT
ncbi:MAG: hypothetical protein HQK56_16730, partial [Deltaproteobacteria bacterium]|nr:hypothetical protein [Deltaproteobacteria bacterium]